MEKITIFLNTLYTIPYAAIVNDGDGRVVEDGGHRVRDTVAQIALLAVTQTISEFNSKMCWPTSSVSSNNAMEL